MARSYLRFFPRKPFSGSLIFVANGHGRPTILSWCPVDTSGHSGCHPSLF